MTAATGPLDAVPAVDALALAPVLAPVVALLAVLLLDAVAPRSRRIRRLLDAVALAGLAGAGVAVAALARGPIRATVCLDAGGPPGGAAAGSAAASGGFPRCSYVASDLTLVLQVVVLAAAIGCLLLALDGPAASDRTPHHVLLLSATAGALALAGARDLATLVVALETASLPAVGLVALRRDAPGAQAALTLLLTAVGSLGLLLLGVGLIVLATGSLHLETIATVLSGLPGPDAVSPVSVGDAGNVAAASGDVVGALDGATAGPDARVRAVAVLGSMLAVAGIGFKISLVPFHLWTPDTYAGAPLPVAAFLATVSKAAGVAAILVLLGLGLAPLAETWAPVIGVLAVLTMTVGNLVALRQSVAVRLLAWSTVAQAGWVLLPLAAADGSVEGVRSAVAASLGYLLAYTAAGLAAFVVVVLVARHHRDGEEHGLDAYRGLARSEPVAAAVLGFALMCLAGLPPGVMGLLAKVLALRPLVDGAGSGVWVLAVLAALNVPLGLAYYLRWAGLLLQRAEAPVEGAAAGGAVDAADGGAGEAVVLRWRVGPAEGLVLGAAAAACVGLSLGGQVLAGLLPGVLR